MTTPTTTLDEALRQMDERIDKEEPWPVDDAGLAAGLEEAALVLRGELDHKNASGFALSIIDRERAAISA